MRVRILQAVALAAVVALAACAPAAPTTGTAADEQTLRAMGGKFADSWNSRDTAALVAMVTDDFQSVAADGKEIKGKAAFEANEKEGMTALTGLPLKLTVNTSYVRFAGANAAALGGTWTMAGVPAGMGADKGAWTSFAVKGTDGQWRLANSLVAEFVPPPAPPTAAPEAGKGKGGN